MEVENEETVEEEVVYPYSSDRDSVDPRYDNNNHTPLITYLQYVYCHYSREESIS